MAAQRRALTAAERWNTLDGNRSGFLDRCREYAGYTLPALLFETGREQNNDSSAFDNNGVGAQAVIGLVNKLMFALFPLTRPFFRLSPGAKAVADAADLGIKEDDLTSILAEGEKKARELLETVGLRPKLYEIMKHLVVTGNCLRVTRGAETRVLALDRYVVKRNQAGAWVELLVCEKVCFDELEEDVQAALGDKRYQPETEVSHYRWIVRRGAKYYEDQWVDSTKLQDAFSGVYTEETCPYSPEVWELADKDNYGTGLVESYSGDFAAISVLSKAELQTAILISEFRWLVNPTGNTRPEDFEKTENGACVPGLPADVQLMSASSKASDLQAVTAAAAGYINRIGIGFLMSKSMIREAERVTAEEIRLLANELESSLGGAYSRLSGGLQTKLAQNLVKMVGVQLKGKDITVIVVSGLAALSRQGDLEAIRGALQDLSGVAQMPPQLLAQLDLNYLATSIMLGWGLDPKRMLLPPEVVAAQQQAAQAQQVAAEVAQAGGVAQAEAAAQSQQP